MARLTGLTTCVLLLGMALVLRAEDKMAALRARLATAATESSLDTPGTAPWHLKLDVQLYDAQGAAGEQGTAESWWIGPKEVETIYSFPSYSATEVISASGPRRTRGKGLPPDAVSALFQQIVHPVPSQADVDGGSPELCKQDFGKVALECVMLDQRLEGSRFPPAGAPLGLFPSFCFDPGQETLRVSFDSGSQITIRNALGKFLGRQIATSVTLRENGVLSATGKIMLLQSRSDLKAPEVDEATLETPLPPKVVTAESMKGLLLSRKDPIYPASAKQRHATGTVVLHAVIGRDGHLRSLRLVKVPDVDLALAALAAVRTWVYRPYMVGGEPVEVETTITVNFAMSG